MTDALVHLDRFYAILAKLDALENQGVPLRELSSKSGLPARGVYFFREPGEYRSSSPLTPRFVRVGTHAVSIGAKATLWNRLRTHRGNRIGDGNHRSSVFRLHVGAALLARNGESLPTWGRGASAPIEVRQDTTTKADELALEKSVSEYLGSMTVLWVEVPDEPGPKSDRAYIERNSIALLSNRLAPIDVVNGNWLGCSSPREEIRHSLLWNLNHVLESVDRQFLGQLEAAVERTISKS